MAGMTAQEAREILCKQGGYHERLTHVAEYWFMPKGRYVVLHWCGDNPEEAKLHNHIYGTEFGLPNELDIKTD